MSLSIAEWVARNHPEWIEALAAEQKKINELEVRNKQLESCIQQLARYVLPGFIEDGRAAHATNDVIVEAIVSKTGVSEKTARRLVSEYRGRNG